MKKFFSWLIFLIKSTVFKSILKALLENKELVIVDSFVLKITSVTDDVLVITVYDKEFYYNQELKKKLNNETV